MVMPDVFREKPWDLAQFPPKDKAEFGAFLERINAAAPADIETVKKHFAEVCC